jgi:SpoVK/Ycf46/Vps4 family AAA+-type ATPase
LFVFVKQGKTMLAKVLICATVLFSSLSHIRTNVLFSSLSHIQSLFIFFFQAVAHHTSATFLKCVGSEFVQKWLGDGPRMVRHLFRTAKEKSPSIIFIDGNNNIVIRQATKQKCCLYVSMTFCLLPRDRN